MNARASSALLRNIADMVALARAGRMPNRHQLARRWGCGIRNVSATIVRARALYGVELASGRKKDGTHGYALVSAGVFDPGMLAKRRRNGR